MAYVYVVGSIAGPVKVGITSAPRERLSGLKMMSPIPIEGCRLFACPKQSDAASLESMAHAALAPKNRHGEWFDVPMAEAADAIQAAADENSITIWPGDEALAPKPRQVRQKTRTDVVAMRLPRGMTERIKHAAAAERRTVTSWVEKLIRDALDKSDRCH